MKTQSSSAGTKKQSHFAQTKNAQGKLAHRKKENEMAEIFKRIEMHKLKKNNLLVHLDNGKIVSDPKDLSRFNFSVHKGSRSSSRVKFFLTK